LEDKVNKTKQFALHFAAAALLIGTSAFAESRHSDATTRNGERRHDRGDRTQVEQRSQVQQRDTSRNWDNRSGQNRTWQNDSRSGQSGSWQQSRSNQNQNFDRNRSYDNRNNNYNNNRNYSTNRSYDRNRGFDRNRGGYTPSYNRGNAYYHDGRISRIERWNGGYRVYLGGALYPFFIPEARFRLFPYRLGLSIHLGGFYNPLGYYDYYDAGNYGYGAGNYGYGAAASAGDVRGLVESVDYRRGSLVIRDDVSGNFVTVMMRGGDPQFDSLRNGDYVDLSGEWMRGYFQAYGVARLDNGNGY
jgi:hypothetical protein